MGTIGRKHGGLLVGKQAGQHRDAVGGKMEDQFRRQIDQRLGQDIGQDQVIGRAGPDHGMGEAGGGDRRWGC